MSSSRSSARPSQITAGRRLIAEMARDGDPFSITLLIKQAARVADRLDVLDRLISGRTETWLALDLGRVVVGEGDQPARVVVEASIDKPVLEERQQTTMLRHLLAEIHRQRAAIPMGVEDDDVLDGL